MPPKRRAAKAPIRSRRQPEVTRGNVVPADYYNEMLSEASAVQTSSGDEGRATKKRKISRRSTTPVTTTTTANATPQSTKRDKQVVFDDYRTEEDSDIDFEDVDLEASAVEEDHHVLETAADRATDLNIAVVVNKSDIGKRARNLSRRLPSSTIEKQKRIDVHKVHLCCLLAHVYTRNAWCNDEHIQVSMDGGRSVSSSVLTSHSTSYSRFSTRRRGRTYSQINQTLNFNDQGLYKMAYSRQSSLSG
jgi:xeroderma pigmentosum group C-complementing protein